MFIDATRKKEMKKPEFTPFKIDDFSYPALERPYTNRSVSFNTNVIGKHNSGWIIKGDISDDDHMTRVDDFSAKHPKFGEVFGNFNGTIYAEERESILKLLKSHPFMVFDKI